MYKLANFDDKEYKELIDRFHSSRKGKPIDNFYQELKKLKPGGFISDDLKKRLDKWRKTSPKGSWKEAGSCVGRIQDFILDHTHGGGEYVHNKKALPSRPINVEEIFHMPCEYDSDWNAMYGITNERKSAMVEEEEIGHRVMNSSLNPNAETFLTFFSLANLDSWQQLDCLAEPIRDEENQLSAPFFKMMRENEISLWSKSKASNYSAKRLISTLTDQMMSHTIFFFEHEIMNPAINPLRTREDEAFNELSFLNIAHKDGWSEFDAYIFLPGAKRCIFIESKLNGDIRLTVKWNGGDIKISQITRAMESAYLFTHHPASNFLGWEYDYLFICPRQKYESGKKKYSKAIPRVQNPNLAVLREEYLSLEEKIDPDPIKKSLFDDFLSTHHEHIHVLFWDQLFDLLEETDPGFLAKYMKNLQLKDRDMYEKWLSRLKLASIPYKK